MHDALADRSSVVYDPYTPEQQQGIRRQLEKFVAAQVRWKQQTSACFTYHIQYCENI